MTADKKTTGLSWALGRYAALAFCRADVLFQVTQTGEIKFCAGPTQRFFGKSDADLVGANILSFIFEEDKYIIENLLTSHAEDARIDDLILRARSASGSEVEIAFSGYRVPDFDNDFFVAIKIAPKQTIPPGRSDEDRDDESGVMNTESFVDVAADRARAYEASGGKPKVSMINIGDLAGAGFAVGSDEEKAVLRTIGDVLNKESLGGDTAGRIDEGNFSLVHGENVDADGLTLKISNALSQIVPAGRSLMPKIATMDASGAGMDEKQMAKAMLYSLQEFTRNDGKMPDGDLTAALERGLKRNVEAVDRFRAICDKGSFDLVYMPVCRLDDGMIHHYEALTRFREEAGESPFHLITLAEEVGVISDFDMAVAIRAIETIERVTKSGNTCTPVAVNVSGHSISDSGFCDELSKLLSNKFGIDKHLSLEITESAEIHDLKGVNNAIQEFRRQGFKVALDDFGAGAASFDYLNSFDVDTVKFDGPVVKRAVSTRKGKAFLASMATLCHEIGVETIAEMVEDAPLAEFLGQCGIELGQGWHFGKPKPDHQAFAGLDAPAPKAEAPIKIPKQKVDTSGMSLLERLRAGQ